MSEFNKESMVVLSDHVLKALNLCLENKETWKNDKYAMIDIIKKSDEHFYETYPRICRMLVFTDDINPLLGMIQTFGRVQAGELSFDKANETITNAINAKYMDNVLYSDKLKNEREEKMKNEKIKVIN